MPQTQQASLRFLQRIALLLARRGFLLGQELLEAIPENYHVIGWAPRYLVRDLVRAIATAHAAGSKM